MIAELAPFEEEHREAVIGIENAIFPEYQNDSVNWRAGQQFDDPTIIHDKTNLFGFHRDESTTLHNPRRLLSALVC